MHHGGSLYGSQGNRDGNVAYTAILQRIAALNRQKAGPKEKARIIFDIVSMLNSWCGIDNLGVKSLGEIFHDYFVEYYPGKVLAPKEIPKLTTSLPMNLRMIPLYAPGRDNHLMEYREFDGVERGEYTSRLLFIDTARRIVCFTTKQVVEGHMILSPYSVVVAYATEDEVAECLGKRHLMFDYCMRGLISLCVAATGRAEVRVTDARKSTEALVNIAEEMRKDDFTTAILLSEEEQRGMSGCELDKDIFRRLVERAGATPQARIKEFERQLAILGRKELTDISHLSKADTMKIIQEWKIEK